MNEIVRHSPGPQTIWDVFNDFDGFFNDFWPTRRIAETSNGAALIPAVDVSETEHEYLVKAELPGVKKEDLDVTIQDGVLTLHAESKYEDEEKKDGRVIRQERRYGRFVRSMRLGNGVDPSKVQAEYKDGILNLRLPKLEEVKPKKVDVKIS
jgi:HSP20 family protein